MSCGLVRCDLMCTGKNRRIGFPRLYHMFSPEGVINLHTVPYISVSSKFLSLRVSGNFRKYFPNN